MDWMKKNPHYLALAVCALLLIAASALVIVNTQSFGEKFAATQTPPTPNNTVDPLVMEPLKVAQASLANPVKWIPKEANGSLFVADRYMIDKTTGKVEKPTGVNLHKHSITGEPIPKGISA